MHSLFIKTDGSLWATGYNYHGELGNSTNNNSSIPVHVADNWLSASAGFYHTLLLKPDNTAWSTGQNSFGQLGTSTYADQNIPVQVLTGVQAVSAGQFHSLWLKTDHTLWASGDGSSGQLGRGTTGASTTPVKVAANVQSISAGAAHTLFTANGDIRTAPPAAPTISSFTPNAISAGDQVTISGSNLSNIVTVYFNGIDAASFTTNSSTQITATAPSNLTAGKIIAGSLDSYATSSSSYTVGGSSSSSSSSGSPEPQPQPSKGSSGGAPSVVYLAVLALVGFARGLSLWARRR
jgi:hypothetical protein